MERELVYSALKTPDGTILESLHRHDFRAHDDKNGKRYIIDGGLSYVRSSMNGDEEYIAVYSDEPFEKVRQYAFRLIAGKKVTLAEMDEYHIEAALLWLEDSGKEETVPYRLLRLEKAWRKKENTWTIGRKQAKP